MMVLLNRSRLYFLRLLCVLLIGFLFSMARFCRNRFTVIRFGRGSLCRFLFGCFDTTRSLGAWRSLSEEVGRRARVDVAAQLAGLGALVLGGANRGVEAGATLVFHIAESLVAQLIKSHCKHLATHLNDGVAVGGDMEGALSRDVEGGAIDMGGGVGCVAVDTAQVAFALSGTQRTGNHQPVLVGRGVVLLHKQLEAVADIVDEEDCFRSEEGTRMVHRVDLVKASAEDRHQLVTVLWTLKLGGVDAVGTGGRELYVVGVVEHLAEVQRVAVYWRYFGAEKTAAIDTVFVVSVRLDCHDGIVVGNGALLGAATKPEEEDNGNDGDEKQ